MSARSWKTWVLPAVLLSQLGCGLFFKRLSAPERSDPRLSLVFGTIRTDTPIGFDELALERVSPGPREELLLTNTVRFKLFREKLVDQGAFLLPNLPPGVYRLSWVRQANTTWHAPQGEHSLLRFEVTAPGVYDVGAFVLHSFRSLDQEEQPDQVSRYQQLLSATAGTQWHAPAQELAAQMVPGGL